MVVCVRTRTFPNLLDCCTGGCCHHIITGVLFINYFNMPFTVSFPGVRMNMKTTKFC
jgi:hypothetical protein